jgi:glutathione S-transferase
MHHPWLTPLYNLKAPQLVGRERVKAWHERVAERPAVQKGMSVPS